MKSPDAIKTFLYDVYGYKRIGQLLDCKKPKGQSLNDFLAGTIVETFRKTAISPVNPTDDGSDLAPVSIYLPGIAKIMTTQEVKDQTQVPIDSKLQDEELPFHISNRNLFRDMGVNLVDAFVRQRVVPLFSGSEYYIKTGKTINYPWEVRFEAENFRLYMDGTAAHNSKGFIVDFNIDAAVVDDIGKITRRFYGFKNS